MDKSKKHLQSRIYVYATLWLLSYVGCLWAIKTLILEKEVGIMLTFLPIATFILFIYKFYRSLFFDDEVHIKIHLEAIAIGFVCGMVLLMALGLLELVIPLKKEDWAYRNLIPYFTIFYFIGLFISKRKYNFNNEKHD
jgi:hypothetical protein